MNNPSNPPAAAAKGFAARCAAALLLLWPLCSPSAAAVTTSSLAARGETGAFHATTATLAAALNTSPSQAVLESKWGVRVEGVRISGGGYVLDFRYRILDPQKAAAFADKRVKPFAVDQASGRRLGVPSPSKVGPLRTVSTLPGRTYFILFDNPGRLVKAGAKVKLVVGDCEIQDVPVM